MALPSPVGELVGGPRARPGKPPGEESFLASVTLLSHQGLSLAGKTLGCHGNSTPAPQNPEPVLLLWALAGLLQGALFKAAPSCASFAPCPPPHGGAATSG